MPTPFFSLKVQLYAAFSSLLLVIALLGGAQLQAQMQSNAQLQFDPLAAQMHAEEQSRSALVNGLLLVGLLCGLGMSFWVLRTRNRLLGSEPEQLHWAMRRMAEGDYAFELPAATAEPGSVLVLLREMQGRLRQSAALAVDNARIRTALEAVNTSVMIADADRNIVYINPAQARLLVDVESDIRKDLPQFNARAVIGVNIDNFHKNPAHQRGILAQLRGTHTARLTIGGRRFKLVMNPIFNADGSHNGTVVEWADETEMLALREREASLAAEQARISAALDNTSVNVMIADAERKIIYMNSAVTRMLRLAENDLRKALPHFAVDKVLGSSMDSFHKSPSHQANLLANLNSTYETKIAVGGRHFRLVANPIRDPAGARLGTVVEWLDITREVAIEQEVSDIIQAAARGDFQKRIRMGDKEGFFKLLAENINSLMDTTDKGLSDVVRMFGALAQGDLTQRIEGDYSGTFGQLRDDGNTTVEKLTEIIVQIKDATDTIGTAAQEIASGNQNLSQRTESQAASLEETASSMEELTSTVKQNAENAKQANQLARGASDIAVKGGGVVGQVVTTMREINDSAKKIVDIIGVIDGIAFQTNILALNAAVEAARAGEQGRGFAVVASEVRNLAQRSAAAAKEIKALIGDSVDKVTSGSRLVDEAGRTMDEVVAAVRRMTDIMSEISAASTEQSAGIEQVNTTITQMDDMTQQNAALVEQAAAAAESMEEQAQALIAAVSAFRVARDATRSLAPVRRQLAASAAPAKVGVKTAAKSLPKVKAKGDDDWSEF